MKWWAVKVGVNWQLSVEWEPKVHQKGYGGRSGGSQSNLCLQSGPQGIQLILLVWKVEGFIAFFEDVNLNVQVLTCINVQPFYTMNYFVWGLIWALRGGLGTKTARAFCFFYSKHSCRSRGRVLGGRSDRWYWEKWPRRVVRIDLLRSRHTCMSEPLLLYFILNVWTPKTCHNSIHAHTRKSAQIPKQAARKLHRGRAGLFLPDTLCLKKKGVDWQLSSWTILSQGSTRMPG